MEEPPVAWKLQFTGGEQNNLFPLKRSKDYLFKRTHMIQNVAIKQFYHLN